MSAYLVSDNHINTLVTFARLQRVQFCLDDGTILSGQKESQRIAEILKAENVRSLNVRYREASSVKPIQFRITNIHFSPLQILGAANCYDYQACECEDYESTPAAQIIRTIKERAIRCLPGYDECIYEIQ